MATTTIEKVADDGSGNEGSCGRRRYGRRKLQMCSSMVEEAAVLSLVGGKSCTRKQRRRRQWLCTKVTTGLEVSYGGEVPRVYGSRVSLGGWGCGGLLLLCTVLSWFD